MSYNHRAIMIAAWEIVRKADVAKFGLLNILRNALRAAWSEAKHNRAMQARADMLSKDTPEARRIRDTIAAIESKSTLTQQDYARLEVLRAELWAARVHGKAAPDYAEKRALIAAACGRFCTVTFTKADGSERIMQVQPATLAKHFKGDTASEPAQRAVKTRKARHPHLLPVWDAKAQAPRSVNLATVKRIAIDGQVHTYAA